MAVKKEASIHAPARGATRAFESPIAHHTLQSTLPHGERPSRPWGRSRRGRLQSTLPHGERPKSAMSVGALAMLQSTLPHGERQKSTVFAGSRIVASIHAPARGATVAETWSLRFATCFNPRSRTGSDFLVVPALMSSKALQSTLPHGERLAGERHMGELRSLQSTLPHGERPRPSNEAATHRLLQSTLPHGERPFQPTL